MKATCPNISPCQPISCPICPPVKQWDFFSFFSYYLRDDAGLCLPAVIIWECSFDAQHVELKYQTEPEFFQKCSISDQQRIKVARGLSRKKNASI